MSELTQAIILLVLVGVACLSRRNAVACSSRAEFYDAVSQHMVPGGIQDMHRATADSLHNAARRWNNVALGMAVLIILFHIVFVM